MPCVGDALTAAGRFFHCFFIALAVKLLSLYAIMNMAYFTPYLRTKTAPRAGAPIYVSIVFERL